jgi:cytochrome c5
VRTIIFVLYAFLLVSPLFAELSGSLDEQQILLRIKPEGTVTIEASPTAEGQAPVQTAAPIDLGKQLYQQYCHTCHATGLAGAPKFADKADWAPRISQGIEILVQHAIHGYKAMPPKGTCMTCSDEDIQKAVDYMVSQAK